MAKSKLVVDREVLTSVVVEVEANGGAANRNALFKAVEVAYNKRQPQATISAAVIALRIKEFGLVLKTPVGKRGRPKKVVSNAVPVTVTESVEVAEVAAVEGTVAPVAVTETPVAVEVAEVVA